jgi:hypothetical protein
MKKLLVVGLLVMGTVVQGGKKPYTFINEWLPMDLRVSQVCSQHLVHEDFVPSKRDVSAEGVCWIINKQLSNKSKMIDRIHAIEREIDQEKISCPIHGVSQNKLNALVIEKKDLEIDLEYYDFHFLHCEVGRFFSDQETWDDVRKEESNITQAVREKIKNLLMQDNQK